MLTSSLVELLGETLTHARSRRDADRAEAVEKLIEVLSRFSSRPVAEFLEKLDKLKPAAARKRVSTKPAPELRAELVELYASNLREVLGDHKLSMEVIVRLSANPKVRKQEAIALAASFGLSPTSKKAALAQLEGLSVQSENDRVTADAIRRGA